MVIAGAPAWATVGWVIALVCLILAVIFMVLGRLDLVTGGLIGGVALARLL